MSPGLKLGGTALLATLSTSGMLGLGPSAYPAPRSPSAAAVRLEVVQTSCDGGLLGDVTGDGAVSLGDAQQLLRAAIGLSVITVVQGRLSSHGDVTGDGSISLGDAQQVLRYAVGLSVSFPIGQNICGSGDIVVRNQTVGTFPADPYTVSLDGGPARDMPAGDPGYAQPFSGITSGEHTVTIGNLQGCNTATVSQTFTLGSTGALVNFAIDCT